ncbi:WS/DGAT/MGAT family acyltransferase [Mycobacterium sp. BK086]|uniref:WS/DGAT/MGAT family O-acyltransferase n=1 Tax=Mycobacterium sp. BK086 TaxID=2512165 RepID=UPI00105ED92D|nr:wax ester/triacylglycerol synthase family O-acyltransferase [Mycobacterium sp. BK086]TDO12110.1 WS/DGAT/MGAT family acyltransferase [Mycobacterium sp. BK086]
MRRLNGMDAMLLYSETPTLHTHTLKVAIVDAADYDGVFDFGVFRRTVEERLHLLEPLRYRLVEIPGRLHHPMWMQDCDVDLGYHLRRVTVPAPGGRRELDALIGRIASTPLDRRYPLWEFHFVEGMAHNRFALIGKVHHTLADGVASANLLARLMDLAGQPSPEPTSYPVRIPPSKRELLQAAFADHLRQARALPRLINDAATGFVRLRRRQRERRDHVQLAKPFAAPATFVNHVVSPVRTFATATLELAQVKETAKHLGVTFTDIVLAVTAGGLRDLLLRHDGSADEPLVAAVPVAIDKSADRVTGNEIGGLSVSLPVHIDDPLERVRLTALASRRAKENYELLGPTVQGRLMQYLPTALSPAAFRWQARHAARNRIMNVAVSSVPGPRQRGNIGGAPVSEIYSVGVLSAGSAFNMTVWSYVDQLDIAILSDDRTFADIHEATEAMVRAFADIRSAAGFSDGVCVVDTAMPPVALAGG